MLEMMRQLDQRFTALQESEERFRILVDAIPDLVWLKDMNGVYLACNPRFEQFVGVEEAELVGRTDYDLFSREEADWFRAHDLRAMEQGRPSSNEEWVVFAGEEEEQLLDTIKTPMFGAKGELVGVLGVAHDITAREKAEKERTALHNQLARAERFESIGRLAGGIAHDYNNMLSVILGGAELILEKLPQDSPHRDGLQLIMEAAKRSADLTRQLLAFARKQKIHPKVLDLNEVVGGMTRMLSRLIGEDIQMVWEPGQGIWPVKLDPSQVDQVLVNLCVNARDAIQGVGTVVLQTENVRVDGRHCAENSSAMEGDFVRLTVADTGSGMEPEVLEQIFEPFFSTKDLSKGTGLGLATVYGVVKQNAGFIEVISVPRQGTTFKIYLPRSTEAGPEKDGVALVEDIQDQQAGILVVEDEQVILSLIGKILVNGGYTVFEANSAQSALHLAREHGEAIDLVLSDVIMPGMNGPELMQELEQIVPGVRCLYMSGYTHDILLEHGIEEDGAMFIHKPFAASALLSMVRKLLALAG
jgi:PAS domain S-box-containing protein